MCLFPKMFLMPVVALSIWMLMSQPVSAQVDAEARAAEVREQLADAELSARLSTGAREGLVPLMKIVNELACGPAFEGRDGLLEEVTGSIIDLLVEEGDLGLAVGMLTPSAHRQTEGSLMTEECMAVWSAVIHGPRLAARRAELVERQRDASRREATGVKVDGAIASTVATLLEQSSYREILELGPRAVPALLEQRRPERASPTPKAYQDPYWYLARIDPAVLGVTLRDDLRAGRLVDLDRAARALLEVLLRYRDSMWLSVAGRAPSFTSDPLLEVMTVLLAEPRLITRSPGGSSPTMFGILEEFVLRDALSSEHAALVGQAGMGMAGDEALQLLDTLLQKGLSDQVALPSTRPALEPLVHHPDALVRRRAASGLVMMDEHSELLELADDPDPVVRAEVARWFTRFPRNQRTFYSNGGVGSDEGDTHIPRPRDEDLGVLAMLCDDPVSSVRRVAAQGAVDCYATLPEATYRGLAGDPDPQVRMIACGLNVSDPVLQAELMLGLARDPDPVVRTTIARREGLSAELRGRVLAVLVADADPGVRVLAASSLQEQPSMFVGRDVALGLARDPDPQVRVLAALTEWPDIDVALDVMAELADDASWEVRSSLDRQLLQMLRSGAWKQRAERFLEVVAVRRRFPTEDRSWSNPDRREYYELLQSAEGVEALTRWALEDGGEAAWDDFAKRLPEQPVGTNSPFLLTVRSGWLRLDDEMLEAALRRVASTRPWYFWFVADALDPLPAEGEAMARRMFETRDGSVALGLLGGRALARRATDADLAALAAFLGEIDRGGRGSFDDPAAGGSFVALLTALCDAMPDDVVNGWLTALIEDDDLAEAFRQELAGLSRQGAPGTVPLAEAVIARWWAPAADIPRCADSAVGTLLTDGAADLPTERLAELTMSRAHGGRALNLLAARRDDVGFAFLSDMILRPDDLALAWWGGSEVSTSRMSVIVAQLVDGLVAHLSDGAAQVLLDAAARTSSSDTRQQLMGGVTRIQEFQDAQAAWERRLSNRATRETAVAEVLALLDDEDPMVRAAAAKSLATLRAVDHLPRLIRMLRDEDERVVEVVGRAIDELHDTAGEGDDS